MSRFFSATYLAVGMATLFVASIPAACYGQVLVSPAFQKQQPPPDKPVAAAGTVLTLRAAGEPDPALRYRFWPSAENRRQGNPMPFVNRAVLLSVQAVSGQAAAMEFSQDYDKFSELTLEELPGDQVRAFLDKFGGAALAELKRAENEMRLEYDLNLNELSAPEILATVLPEYQEMRQLARLLFLRARLAIAEERWDDFVDDVRLGFRLAEITGHSNDFLVARLVGYAISGLMMGVVEEAIQRPGCPNLYWALASMPETRLVEIRNSIELESIMISRLFKDIGPLPSTPIGAEAARVKLQKLVEDASETLSLAGDDDAPRAASLLAGFYVVTMADPSRELLSQTTWGDRAWKLSAPEAVLRAMHLKFVRIRDNWSKWAMLPAEFWQDYENESTLALQDIAGTDLIEVLVMQLTPAVEAARRASQRSRQARNYLLTIEALRMYAAANGELPATIEKLRPVPAWPDGMTLKSFGYTRTSPTAATLTRHARWPGDKDTEIQMTLAK